MNISILRELGEWAAIGFYEGIERPWPVAYGLAYRRLYENMPITVPESGWLFPCEPLPHAQDFTHDEMWTATSLILDHHHHQGLRVNEGIAADRAVEFPGHAEFIRKTAADLKNRLPHFGGYTHSNPDIRRIVDEGYLVIREELKQTYQSVIDENGPAMELNLLEALTEYSAGVDAFHMRALEAVGLAAERAGQQDRQRFEMIHRSLESAFVKPARSFYEGLLSVNFLWMLDGCDSIGRLDQALGPLLERDLATGNLDINFARALLDELFLRFERFNGWNLQIGGRKPDGSDGTNRLTEELIRACGRNHFRRPNVAFRITSDTPREAKGLALATLRDGSGRPALYNDDLYINSLYNLPLELSIEDAREIGFGGCTETMIAGLSNVGSLEGSLNFAVALERALFNGVAVADETQCGPETGHLESFNTYEEFEEAVRKQIGWLTDEFVRTNTAQLEKRFHQGDPKMARTLFTRDCVIRRRSFESGGARYNWCVVSYQGIANLIDSLAAVRQCVYDDGSVPAAELVEALRTNFVGYENVRRLLTAAPKFGNDDGYVDEPGADIIQFAWDTLLSNAPPRGGRYIPSCILFATYAGAGAKVGALPDGRGAGEPLTDSVGPFQGRDVKGPTAMLKSVAKLPLYLAAGTPVLNIRFQKSIMDTSESLERVIDLVDSFFELGGMQIQLSVLDSVALTEAQRAPEKHKDLIVRIGGYSEYFVNLSPELQEAVMQRTEHE